MAPRQQTVVEVAEYNKDDPAAAVRVVQRDVPEPKEGEVLVRIVLRPANPADLFSLQGVYPGFVPEKLPAVPGLDGVGRVEGRGPGATRLEEGTRVVGTPWPTRRGNGSWQQYVCVPQDDLFPVGERLSDEDASQFFVNPVTAYGFFDTLKVPKGEWLLSNAASSVLGRMVIELGKHYGVHTVNLVRSKEHVEDLKALGADEVIVTGEEDVVKRVREVTGGKGAYAALECVGGDITAQVVSSMRDGGLCLIYGAMAEFASKTCIPDLLFRDCKLHGFWLNLYLKSVGERRGQVLKDVLRLLEEGVIKPYAGQRFPLEEVQEAVREVSKPKRGGKPFLEG